VSVRARSLIVTALIAVSMVAVVTPPAQASSTAEGYQRITVNNAGISILVPRDWKISKGPNGSWSAIAKGESGRSVSVGIAHGYSSSLPSPAQVRAYLAGLARQTGGPFQSVTVKRTRVADTPAIVQSVLSKHVRIVTYLFQARSGRVVYVTFGLRAAPDPEFDDMTDSMILSVRLVS
jgi:hypothetical protein